MQILESPAEMRAWSATQHRDGHRIGFIPTMGALHEGHLALIGEARRRCDRVVVSVFVNPMQFNRTDDFEKYPRPLDSDLDQCRQAGADAVYAPTQRAMYPPGFQTFVEPGALAEPLEGAGRPGHFRGVTTVVSKLFTAVDPDIAVFGQKDFQQLAVITQMVGDLDFGVQIVPFPTVRELDGLALSSRNRRLSAEQRSAAVIVPRALDVAERAIKAGVSDEASIVGLVQALIDTEPLARLEYVAVVDPDTLQPPVAWIGTVRVLIAVWFGDIRLIDNRSVDRVSV
jgi:pantoate--beta-alanine ligase